MMDSRRAKSRRQNRSNASARQSDQIGTKVDRNSESAIATECSHLLFALESTCVNCSREDGRIDDAAVIQVLRNLVRHDPPAELPHAWLYSELSERMLCYPEVKASTWTACLRYMIEAVRARSSFAVGEVTYLAELIHGQSPGKPKRGKAA